MTASTLGGMDDDTLSLGTVQTDHLSSASIEKNYCRIIKLLIHNGIPKYEIKCPFVLPGKRYSIHATFKRSKLFPKLTTEKNNSFFSILIIQTYTVFDQFIVIYSDLVPYNYFSENHPFQF